MKIGTLFAIFVSFTLCGCGYTARSVLPSGESSIYVENFSNKIDVTRETSDKNNYYAYKPAIESDITRAIIDRIIFDGNYKIQDSENARFLLKGELVDFRREPLRYDANDNVTEYRISVVVDMELRDLKEGKIVWVEKNFAGESTYRTQGQYAASESATVEEAIVDLARRIVERTVENW